MVMEILEKYNKNNFYIIFTIIIISTLHMYISIEDFISMCL